MAATLDVSVLGSWQADSVTVGQVEAALSDLRRHEERAAVRTSVLTLVIVVDRSEDAAGTLDIVRELGGRHPSRTLVLCVGGDENEDSSLDANAAVLLVERGGRQVCVEEVTLEVRGRARLHLDSLVLPFSLPDLPVAVWLPEGLPSAGDPLLEAANRVIVDTRVVGDQAGALTKVASLTRRLPVTDLSWTRLRPWRELLATLFEGRRYRPFLDGVQHVEVLGHFGPRHLLAGWLMSRLDLPRARVHVAEAEHVAIKLVASDAGRTGRFEVERKGDERVIDAAVDIDGGPSYRQTLQFGADWPSRSLADALTRMGHDEVYEGALKTALGLLR
jgi:glucose-6-phosphate dehydrogenase assembly protein OpcA